ncbi:MAG: phosphoribosylamine--glycine ligase [Rikenellaceae bacterium]
MKLPSSVNVLLLGGGAREHAIAKSIAKSNRINNLYIAPGNGGTQNEGTNIELSASNFASIKQFVISNNINLVVVGPEEPLVLGIEDFFLNDDDIKYIPVVGPSFEAAKLEGSKQFAKDFMERHSIPTAAYKTFSNQNIAEANNFLDSLSAPYVLKANGLAAGKGVVILDDLKAAKAELSAMLDGKFGQASKKVVIEEFLKGIELSVFVALDGKSYKILPTAKDYKRALDGDKGLNTGGMGAVSPVPFADFEFMQKVEERIIKPTVNGLIQEDIRYNGFIFIGLMNVDGDPYVIEYNVRLGDPETEVVVARIESDIIDLFEGIVYQSLKTKELKISDEYAVTVMCVAEGYPNSYNKGDKITGIENVVESTVYQAGTKIDASSNIVTSGGRVLCVTSKGKTIQEALTKSYESIDKIKYKGKNFRTDIGQDLIALQKQDKTIKITF